MMKYFSISSCLLVLSVFSVFTNVHAQEMQDSTMDAYKEQLLDEALAEAEEFLTYCSNDSKMANFYDCECLSAKFLDVRLTVGPEENRTSIMQSISRECLNAAIAAGEEYQECLANITKLPPKRDPEEYCACVANTYAKLFEDNNAKPSSRNFIKFRTQARVQCRDPALARRLYGVN